MLRLFVLLGRASLPIARLYEAHVNALQLIERYGAAHLADQAARDAVAGHIFALWVTDPRDPLVLAPHGAGFELEGANPFAPAPGLLRGR